MKKLLFILSILFYFVLAFAQNTSTTLNKNWQFSQQGKNKWYKATIPGTIHTDLLANKLIPNPFYRDNESKLQWIDTLNWEYKTVFNIDEELFSKKNIDLVFDGLDTYADVYLNGNLILQANNMFRGFTINAKPFLKKNNNQLKIIFSSAQKKVDSIAKAMLPIVLPDNNRVYVRKAQFQFGWDWGPKFVGCGIWKPITLQLWDYPERTAVTHYYKNIKLIQKKDSIGTSFYFEQNGKPIYAKGANWIPANIFLPSVKKEDYRKLLQRAKDANMNMLRVWGGGVYEADEFYDLCDEMGIMVWQDFMFAGGMYPADDAFLQNVKEEVKYQIERIRHHPCIVLWCGNNEIDEAWKNWGWQNQYNLHNTDSTKIWNDYKKLFVDSLQAWVKEFDDTRPYISTSPKNGWGHKESFTEGDSHYWGVWWGLEDWEVFENKTGRFVSEYGMQAMPNWNTIKSYTNETDRTNFSTIITAHQKANEGFKKLNHYLNKYFIDTSKLSTLSLENYTYLTQCLQYYILKNSIAIHRSKYPKNMGTLLWQLNDCWPVTSWSIIDFSKAPKAAWYAVKEGYRDDVLPIKDSVYPKNSLLTKPTFTLKYISKNSFSITSNVDAKYVYLSIENEEIELSDNYFDVKANEPKIVTNKSGYFTAQKINALKIKSLYNVVKGN
jgi:beta-mannosidase